MARSSVKRTFYQDRWNRNKVWEVVKLSGGYYLRQYIHGRQVSRGLRTTKEYIQSVGIFDFEKVTAFRANDGNEL